MFKGGCCLDEQKRNPNINNDAEYEGREEHFMDIDRMVNEGLGAGRVTDDQALIENTTTDTMDEQ
jgi:hypothetical protein